MIETNVFALSQPGTFTDSLTEVLREGARALLARAVEAEVADFLARHADRKTEDGGRRVVPHATDPHAQWSGKKNKLTAYCRRAMAAGRREDKLANRLALRSGAGNEV